MNQNPGGPIGLTTLGSNNSLVAQGVTITMQPSGLHGAVAVGLGDSNPNWTNNITSLPPPASTNIQCGSAIIFVPQTISAITGTIEAGFDGGLALTRSGYITGCSQCGTSGCAAQNVSATETWAYSGNPTP